MSYRVYGAAVGCAPSQDQADAARARGNALFQAGSHEAAIQAYTEALQHQQALNPAGSIAASRLFSNRAAALLRLAPPAPAAALEDAQCAIRADPGWPKAYYRSACARRLLGDLDGAVADCRRALPAPTDPGGGRGGPGGAQQAPRPDEAAALLSELLRDQQRAQQQTTDDAPGGAAAGLTGPMPLAATLERSPVEGTDPRVRAARSAELGAHLAVDAAGPPLPPALDVLYDRPLATVLLKRWRRRRPGVSPSGGGSGDASLRCWHCTAPLEGGRQAAAAAPYPCLFCPMALYCSTYCRDSDSFHVPGGCECGLPWGAVLPEEALLACRLVRLAAAEEAVPPAAAEQAVAGASCDADTGGARARPCAPGCQPAPPPALTRQVLDGLLAHDDALPPAELFSVAVLAVVTAAAYRSACHAALRRWQRMKLQPGGQEPAAAAADALRTQRQAMGGAGAEGLVAAAAGMFLGAAGGGGQDRRPRRPPQRWLSGAVPVAGLRPPEVSGLELFLALCRIRVNGVAVQPDASCGPGDRLALALYPVAAALNHSCRPNLGLRFRGLQLIARTCRPVAPGSQLTISYGPQRGKVPREQRITELKVRVPAATSHAFGSWG
ncbi:hypothetical protein GPECTOR_136g635 [Gonium pectorale]|uniref:SET domain-containing protein n=1 Tax=Gonium pectorale TaxID=33097 RepID=A0A150FY59_GONPE|nr:hypothetical protein GPECTOR_136g635 [Gonium pectorale]|eukprot:KXZ42552.1 hypothetical protein GPECTOR_136g635 [Gonium pectorale]